jgi:hypothetical protein
MIPDESAIHQTRRMEGYPLIKSLLRSGPPLTIKSIIAYSLRGTALAFCVAILLHL